MREDTPLIYNQYSECGVTSLSAIRGSIATGGIPESELCPTFFKRILNSVKRSDVTGNRFE